MQTRCLSCVWGLATCKNNWRGLSIQPWSHSKTTAPHHVCCSVWSSSVRKSLACVHLAFTRWAPSQWKQRRRTVTPQSPLPLWSPGPYSRLAALQGCTITCARVSWDRTSNFHFRWQESRSVLLGGGSFYLKLLQYAHSASTPAAPSFNFPLQRKGWDF